MSLHAMPRPVNALTPSKQARTSDDPAVQALLEEYGRDGRVHRIGKRYLPERQAAEAVIQQVLELVFPGFWGRLRLEHDDLRSHLFHRVTALRVNVTQLVELAMLHRDETTAAESEAGAWTGLAARIADSFADSLPALRRVLLEDVQAAFDGDPAAKSLDEVVLSYPGLLAVAVYRAAHQLHTFGVPLVPRMMTEWAHAQTGADIHPGATIGSRFFIDHATGVVIGETTVVGARVKLYQGVTLGALSTPYDPDTRRARRHPTVEDDVTIYANATVLGGNTVIGAGSVIGAGAFVTESVPKASRIGTDTRER